MSWTGPTLGWGVLEWMAAYLPSPRDEAQPLILTDEQAEYILAWYAVDQHGIFLYRRAISERAKGWGKSPLHGALALAELGAASPDDSAAVLFDGWRGKGKDDPVGRPWGTKGSPAPWVQISAVSEDQTDNTYSSLYQMLVANDHHAAKALGIDDGRTRLYLKGRQGRLEPVTASAGSREGQPLTFAILDETHLYVRSNGGTKLAATIRRNAAKMNGRTAETTNAPQLGENSVAEQSGKASARGFAGILWDNARPVEEPEPGWSDERLLASLDVAYGDAWWVDKPRLLGDIRDPATDWADALRFFFNIRVAGAGKAADPRVWDDRKVKVTRDVPPGTRIGLGFDGSVSGDATFLRGCTADGYSFLLGKWIRPKDAADGWAVSHTEVNEAVERAFATYRVGRMFADPPYWRTDIETWTVKYGEEVVLVLDTNQSRRFAPAVDRWRTALRLGTHTHDGDPDTDEHVKAAHLKKVRVNADDEDGRTQYVIVKGDDRRKIDGAVADILALEAAMTMPVDIPVPTPRFIPIGAPAPRTEPTAEQEAAEIARFFGE